MTDFTYIAFDTESGQPVAHGRSAIDSLARADSIAPPASLHILFTGDAGPWMWAEKFPLEQAQAFASNTVVGER